MSFYVLVFRVSVSVSVSELNVLIGLINNMASQSGDKINHVLRKFVFTLFRSSHRRCFIKKAVLKNFAIFSWKHLCWSLILIKLQGFSSATLSKRDSNTGVFLWLLRNFKEHLFEEHLRTAASVYSNDLFKYKNCVIKNMLPERFWVYKEKSNLQKSISFVKKHLELLKK